MRKWQLSSSIWIRKNLALCLTVSVLSLFGVSMMEHKSGLRIETPVHNVSGSSLNMLQMPGVDLVTVRVSWPSNWTSRTRSNQTVPVLGADVLTRGMENRIKQGSPFGVRDHGVESVAFSATSESLVLEITAPPERILALARDVNLAISSDFAQTELLDLARDTLYSAVVEESEHPYAKGFEILRSAVLKDHPLKRFLSLSPPEDILAVQFSELNDWRKEVFTQSNVHVVISGSIDERSAVPIMDVLLSGLPEKKSIPLSTVSADFSPKKVVLEDRGSSEALLIMVAPMPPTSQGGELVDVALMTFLDESAFFARPQVSELISTPSPPVFVGYDQFSAFSRFLYVVTVVKADEVAFEELRLRDKYELFVTSKKIGDIENIKSSLSEVASLILSSSSSAAYSMSTAQKDGKSPEVVISLQEDIDRLSGEDLVQRVGSSFPKATSLSFYILAPTTRNIRGACVISRPEMAADCESQ